MPRQCSFCEKAEADVARLIGGGGSQPKVTARGVLDRLDSERDTGEAQRRARRVSKELDTGSASRIANGRHENIMKRSDSAQASSN